MSESPWKSNKTMILGRTPNPRIHLEIVGDCEINPFYMIARASTTELTKGSGVLEELVDSLSLTSVLVAEVQTAGLEKGVQSTQAMMNAEQRESLSSAQGSSCVAVSLTAAHVSSDVDYHLMWPARLGSGS